MDWLFSGIRLTEDDDDNDSELKIRDLMNLVLQPIPERREPSISGGHGWRLRLASYIDLNTADLEVLRERTSTIGQTTFIMEGNKKTTAHLPRTSPVTVDSKTIKLNEFNIIETEDINATLKIDKEEYANDLAFWKQAIERAENQLENEKYESKAIRMNLQILSEADQLNVVSLSRFQGISGIS